MTALPDLFFRYMDRDGRLLPPGGGPSLESHKARQLARILPSLHPVAYSPCLPQCIAQLFESQRRASGTPDNLPGQPPVDISTGVSSQEQIGERSKEKGESRREAALADGDGASQMTNDQGPMTQDKQRVLLSACIIARDNERTIRDCIESFKPWVDDIVVVDTGSTDRTVAICLELGCRVFHFPWCDDFAAARNESLKHALGKWIFCIDTDDTIDAANGRLLRELASRPAPPELMAYIGRVLCPGPGPEGHLDVTAVHQVKLFRNRPDLCFEFRIHEQILPSIRRVGGTVAFSGLRVVHANADHTPQGRRRKLRRDVRILKLEIAEHPNCAFTLFNLGMTYLDAKKARRAASWLRQSIAVSEPGDSHLRKAYALLASALLQLHRLDEAAEACRRGLEVYPGDTELLFRRGLVEQDQGRFRQARLSYLECLAGNAVAPTEPHLASLDIGIGGFKTRHNLALLYGQMGNLAAEEDEWRSVVAEAPAYRDGWRALMDNLINQAEQGTGYTGQVTAGNALVSSGIRENSDPPLTTHSSPPTFSSNQQLRTRNYLAEAEQIANSLLADRHLCGQGYLTLARLAQGRGDVAAAGQLLATAIEACPDDAMPLAELCNWLWRHGAPADAATALAEMIRRNPRGVVAYYNLALAQLRLGLSLEAAASLRQAIRFEPRHEQYRKLLAAIEA